MPRGSIGFRWEDKTDGWNLGMKDGLDGSDLRPPAQLDRCSRRCPRRGLQGSRRRPDHRPPRPGQASADAGWPGPRDHGVRSPGGPARRPPRLAGRTCRGVRRRRRPVYSGLAGEAHGDRTRQRCRVRPAVGPDRGNVERALLGHHRVRFGALVPRQPELSGSHHSPRPLRLRRRQRGRAQPLYRSGEGRAGRLALGPVPSPRLAGDSHDSRIPPLFTMFTATSGATKKASRTRGRRRDFSPKTTPWTSKLRRSGWAGCPSIPQFDRNPLALIKEAEEAGAESEEEIVAWLAAG